VEAGEPVEGALHREIVEELGVEVERADPWIMRVFAYPHATVRLHFFRVRSWRGDIRALEHDAVSWQPPSAITVAPLLPANGPVVRALLLPDEYAITRAAEVGVEEFLRLLALRLRARLRLIQVREKQMPPEALRGFAERVVALARPFGAKVLVNADLSLAQAIGADGVHLTSAQLREATARPDVPWCAVSCHSRGELAKAAELGADFAVLSPVLPTPSHPDAVPLGWSGFGQIAAGAQLPVYALGGLVRDDLEVARQHGAHGVAMLRGAWM
jgi:8-oxo-dGTP diphosphatase